MILMNDFKAEPVELYEAMKVITPLMTAFAIVITAVNTIKVA